MYIVIDNLNSFYLTNKHGPLKNWELEADCVKISLITNYSPDETAFRRVHK